MDSPYHKQITIQALENLCSPRALDTIVLANLNQDRLLYLLGGYPHFHFDDSTFSRTYAYLDEQRQIVLATLLRENDPTPAWEACGRITHALQDFYAHSNYIKLWLETLPPGAPLPDPRQVDALRPELLSSPRLFTGRVFLALEILGLIPLLNRLLIPLFPPDTHIRMNLDKPSSGPLFPYAIAAAIQRTRHEFDQLTAQIPPPHLLKFLDQ